MTMFTPKVCLNTPAQLCQHTNPTDTLYFAIYSILPLRYYPETIKGHNNKSVAFSVMYNPQKQQGEV